MESQQLHQNPHSLHILLYVGLALLRIIDYTIYISLPTCNRKLVWRSGSAADCKSVGP